MSPGDISTRLRDQSVVFCRPLACREGAKITAKIYTDVSGLGMRAEMAKVPWVVPGEEPNAQRDAQQCGIPNHSVSLADIIRNVVEVMKTAGSEQFSHILTLRDTLGHKRKLGAGAGFEPATFRL